MTKQIDLHEHISRAAEHVYSAIAQEGVYAPETVHRQTVCHKAAELLVKYLLDVAPAAVRETREIVPGWTDHSYVDVLPDGDLIADPTWQQFVGHDQLAEGAPKVLIGSRSEVVGKLREHGVREEILQIYQNQSGDKID